jgi:N-acetylglucosamine-6-phosphate deacetylase
MANNTTAFINGRACIRGKEIRRSIFVDLDSGLIVSEPKEGPLKTVDLNGYFLAPSFLELQTNGCLGVHFTSYEDSQTYQENLRNISRHLVTQGVGSFYVTLPTVSSEVFKKVSILILSSSLRSFDMTKSR